MKSLRTILMVALGSLGMVDSFSSGAVGQACFDMNPGHGFPPQQGSAPAKLSATQKDGYIEGIVN